MRSLVAPFRSAPKDAAQVACVVAGVAEAVDAVVRPARVFVGAGAADHLSPPFRVAPKDGGRNGRL